jgi:hypothetical protein
MEVIGGRHTLVQCTPSQTSTGVLRSTTVDYFILGVRRLRYVTTSRPIAVLEPPPCIPPRSDNIDIVVATYSLFDQRLSVILIDIDFPAYFFGASIIMMRQDF